MGLFDDLVPSGGDGGPPAALRFTVTPNERQPRGIRNNNPGNIEDGSFARSLPGYAGSDGRFARYETPEAGQGAMDRLLESYGKRGFNTPASIINRWAPPTDKNPTDTYSRYVAEGVGGDPTAQLDMSDPNVRRIVAERITQFENGQRAPAQQRSTEVSAQSRQPIGLFNDLVPVNPPSSQATSPPESSPPAGSGGRFTDTAGENFRTAREGVSPGVATKAEALGKGAARAATFNFLDELNALARAGGLDPNDADGINAAIGLIRGGYKVATGDQDAQETYRAEVSKQRADTERVQEQQPGASLAGEVGGIAATLPFGVGRAAATLGGRALQGARTGAIFGGLSGAGEGTDLQSRATGGLVGAGTGAAVGTVAPVAVEGVIQGARGLAAPFGQAAQVIRGIRDPEAEAARRVTGALQRDASVAGGPPGISPADFAASRTAGGPATIMDLGGETTRGLARSAANTSPEGRAVLSKTIDDRFESQSERVAGWLNKTFGPSDTGATRDALQVAARNANQPAYNKAFAQGRVGVWDQDLAELAQAPIMQDAIKAATKQAQNRSAPDVGKGGNLAERWVSPSGKPTLEFWDLVKRQLDQEINVAKRAGRSADVQEVTRVKDLLVTGKLDQAVPSYAQARQGAAKFFGANDALEAGEKFLTSNAPLNEARRALGQMSQPERELFRDGFVQSLVQKIEATGDRRNVLNAIAQSPKAQQQIEMVMGPQKAREFEAMLRVEGVMDLARGAVQGNSTTARQLTELGLAGGTYGIGTGGNVLDPNPTAMMSAALVYGAARGKGAIDQRVARKVAEMLTSNDPNVLRKGIQIVSRNRSALEALRAFDRGVARSGAQQTSGVPAIQAAGIGRAEDDQPEINRP